MGSQRLPFRAKNYQPVHEQAKTSTVFLFYVCGHNPLVTILPSTDIKQIDFRCSSLFANVLTIFGRTWVAL